MPTYHEAARDIPIVAQADVLVCGGGPAGVTAALTAARCGARTILLEVAGCLGGTWTAGAVGWIIDAANKPGIMREITTTLEQRGARGFGGERDYAYDPEALKLLLEELCLATHVQVQLHTRVVAAVKDNSNRLSLVITESKSGRQAWAAQVFIDATGDGDLAAQSGCGFDLGREGSGELQPMSLEALVTGVRFEEITTFVHNGPYRWLNHRQLLLEEMQRGGVSPSYAKPTLFHLRENLYVLAANHEYGVSPLDAGQISQATMRARAEMNRLVAALRALGGVWRGLQIVATAEQIGVREGRRIHGHYTVTVDDMLQGQVHDDAICRVTIGIDVHSTNANKGKGTEAVNQTQTLPFDIPLRALIARDVHGLLLAGRCISGDFLAHSGYRVTGDAVATGQGAGALAAVAVQSQRLPHEVPWAEVRAALAHLGAL
jgi:hypothetical protein